MVLEGTCLPWIIDKTVSPIVLPNSSISWRIVDRGKRHVIANFKSIKPDNLDPTGNLHLRQYQCPHDTEGNQVGSAKNRIELHRSQKGFHKLIRFAGIDMDPVIDRFQTAVVHLSLKTGQPRFEGT